MASRTGGDDRSPLQPPAPRHGRRGSADALAALVLLVVPFLAYLPAMNGEFIWDDVINVFRNPLLSEPGGLRKIWFSTEAVDYYPLTTTTWWLEWHAWGRHTVGYHALNVMLHAYTAVLLWQLLKALRVPGAWLAALVFTLHPVNVETVAWISERKNTLSMFFFAAAMLLFVKATGRSSAGERTESDDPTKAEQPLRRGLYWASVGTFALGLLSKPSGVMLPVVLLAVEWYRRGRIGRADVLRSVPFFVLSAVISAVTIWVHNANGIGSFPVRTDSFPARLAGAGWAVWFYLDKLVRPVGLMFIYPRWEIDPRSAVSYLPLAALALLSALFYWGRRWWGRGPLLALVYFVAMLFPVLGFFNIYFFRFSFVADHWVYPAAIGAIALMVGTATALLRRAGRRAVAVGSVAATGVVVVLGVLSYRHAGLFAAEDVLWRHAAEHNPAAWIAWHNLGDALAQRGQLEEAERHLRHSLSLALDDFRPHLSLGLLCQKQPGREDEALEWFRRAVALAPDRPDAHIALADALAARGDAAGAIRHFEQTLRLEPDAVQARTRLAALYRGAGRPEDALRQLEAVARLMPDKPAAHFVLAHALLEMGRTAEARERLARYDDLTRDDRQAAYNAGTALLAAGFAHEAAGEFARALRLAPDNPQAHLGMGRVHEALGRTDAAAASYETALRLQPYFPEATAGLRRVRGEPAANSSGQ